jgi:hypothetical protein
MGEVSNVLIPRDPFFLPNDPDAVLQAMLRMHPKAQHIARECSAGVVLRDCGANLADITCPACRAQIAIGDWQQLMDGDYDGASGFFRMAPVAAPCCGHRGTLNELIYDWPMGFSRFAISVRSPGRTALNVDEVTQLGQLVGSPVMLFYRLV